MALNQSNDVVSASIGLMYDNDKTTLIQMLIDAGYVETENASKREILDASFKALKDSPKFRKSLQAYLDSAVAESEFSNYVDSDFFNLTPDPVFLQRATTNLKPPATLTARPLSPTAIKPAATAKKDSTAVGNLLKSIFSQENINTAIGTGVNVAAAKIQQNANRAGEQRAIDFEVARAQAAIAEAQAAQAKDASKKRNAWLVPVAVIGGLLIVGTIVFFAVRKRKQS